MVKMTENKEKIICDYTKKGEKRTIKICRTRALSGSSACPRLENNVVSPHAGTDTDYVLGLQKAFQECKTPDEFYDRGARLWSSTFSPTPKASSPPAAPSSTVKRPWRPLFDQVPSWSSWTPRCMYLRLGDWSSRGIVLPDGIEDLDALYAFRRPLYEKWANLTLDTSVYSLESCVQTIEWLFG